MEQALEFPTVIMFSSLIDIMDGRISTVITITRMDSQTKNPMMSAIKV
jgi:uncharacterized protein involved in response to NO